jgi:antibiotic biosynthesis monooxygenase (ABM) superfamily enzyme
VGIATVRSSLEDIENAPKQLAILTKARQICGIGQHEVVLADEPGFEFSLNNRVIATPYQFTHLVRSGTFPLELWQNDLMRPDVRCLVVHTDILERPLSAVNIQTDLFPPQIRETLSRRFELAAQDGGMRVYRLRSGKPPDLPKS